MSNITNEQWNYIWSAIHILGKTYIPSKDNKDAFICFFQCLSNLLPDVSSRNNLRSFMEQYNIENYTSCGNKTFEWTYLLHNYINNIKKRRGQKVDIITLDNAIEKYMTINIKKWGNSVWFLIHFISANLPPVLPKSLKEWYKAFIVCLKFLLPCNECRHHMTKYLKQVNIDRYLDTREGVFKWSWEFHNTVNTRLNKPLVDYASAIQYYTIPKYGYQLIDEI